MKRPEFNRDEEFLIAYYRQFHKSNQSSATIQDVVVVAVGVAFFALGYFKDDIIWSAIGFGLVAYRALRGVISAARYNRSLASIIEKYEAASKTAIDQKQGADGDAEEAAIATTFRIE